MRFYAYIFIALMLSAVAYEIRLYTQYSVGFFIAIAFSLYFWLAAAGHTLNEEEE